MPFSASGEGLSKEELGKQLAYTALHLADYRQTRNLITTPGMEELNPILGPHPSSRRVDYYFAATLASHWAITYALPSNYRKPWQEGTIALELFVVGRNKHLGLRMNF